MIHIVCNKTEIAIRQAQQGDKEAFAELYSHYYKPLNTLVRFRVGPSAAEDIVQDAFSLAFQHLPKLRETSRFGPWLMQIGRNCCRRWLENNNKVPKVVLDEISSEFLHKIHLTVSPMTLTDLQLDLQFLLDALPEKYRLPLQLHYYDDLSLAHIASVLDLPVTTVKWRIHRALEICRLQAVKYEYNKKTKED